MKLKLIPLIVLLTMSTLFFSPTVLSMALPVTPSISVTDAIYGVNDQGNTIIHLTGKLTSVSVDTCQFRLEIPEEFEVATLIDGSPIMKFVDNGSAQEIELKETELDMVFILQTFDTTLLPKSYNLEVIATTLQYSGKITPQWPEQNSTDIEEGGGGERSNPYIYDFIAYDSEKGQTEHVRTWIHNPAGYPKYLSFLKYKIKAYDYYTIRDSTTPWHDWTQPYYENRYIWDGYTLVVDDHLACIFADHSNDDKYALNKGDYDVTEIYAYGSGWAAYDYPTSNNDFNVKDPSSGMNVVFAAHLVDDDFRSAFDEASFLNDLEGDEYSFSPSSKTLKDDYDIDFVSGVYDWDTSTSNIDTAWRNLPENAGDALGLEWAYTDNRWVSSGSTSRYNHGFDILFGSSWITPSGSVYGKAAKDANMALIMKHTPAFRLAMHEILHIFDCHTDSNAHVTAWGGYIMYGSGSPSWPFGWWADYMHSATSSTLIANDDTFDGYDWS